MQKTVTVSMQRRFGARPFTAKRSTAPRPVAAHDETGAKLGEHVPHAWRRGPCRTGTLARGEIIDKGE